MKHFSLQSNYYITKWLLLGYRYRIKQTLKVLRKDTRKVVIMSNRKDLIF